MSQFHSVSSGERPAGPEQLHGEWRMGDQGVAGLEALGVLRPAAPPPPTWASPTTSSCSACPLLHRQRHHPLPALLLLNRPGVLPAHRLQVGAVAVVAAAAAGGSALLF